MLTMPQIHFFLKSHRNPQRSLSLDFLPVWKIREFQEQSENLVKSEILGLTSRAFKKLGTHYLGKICYLFLLSFILIRKS